MDKIEWLDLSGYGMKLFVAVLPTSRAMVIDGGDDHATALRTLGFDRKASGKWVRPLPSSGPLRLSPREFTRIHFPQARMEMMDKDVVLVRFGDTRLPAAAAVEKQSLPAAAELFLGINHRGQEVYEGKSGIRHVLQPNGQRLQEDRLPTPFPGTFLRAVDDTTRIICAEGYIEGLLKGGQGDHVDIGRFLSHLGPKGADRQAFISALSVAANRYVSKNQKDSLRDRFGRAVALRRHFHDKAIDLTEDFDTTIVLRRLMGIDRDLIGAVVHQTSPRTASLAALLPKKGMKDTSDAFEATICVDVSLDADSMLSVMAGRKIDSRTISCVPCSDTNQAVALVAAVAKIANVEAAAFVQDPSGNRLVVVANHSEHKTEPATISDITDDGAFWSWSAMVASSRTKAIEAFKSGLSSEADLNASVGIADNQHQVPYASASKVGTPITLVPKELDRPTKLALDRIISNFGDVDAKVAYDCGLPLEQLGDFLAPEQVDAAALAIHAMDRERAFLLADNTGVGKGRVLIALALRAIQRGEKVVILTKNEGNLNDLARDLKALLNGRKVRLAVINDVTLVDAATGANVETLPRQEMLAAIATKSWPDADIVIGTHSQFNESAENSPRSGWLHAVVDSETLLIGDEIHEAASKTSNTGSNVRIATEQAGNLVVSSATHAADAAMMEFFKRLFPLDTSNLGRLMSRGGLPFQEVVSTMLVSDGVMIRRELDMSQIKFSTIIDSERSERNKGLQNRLAEIIAEMAALSGDLDNVVEKKNKDSNALAGLQMKRIGIGAPIYTMTRLFNLALMTDMIAESAISDIKSGVKPIIVVENTIQALMDEAAAGDGKAPDFKAVLHRVLGQISKVSLVAADKAVKTRQIDALEGNDAFEESDESLIAVGRIRQMIDQFPDLPASFIDEVKNRIRAAGMTIGEITGRSHEIDQNGVIVRRTDTNRVATRNSFNDGGLDAVIMNVAGLTFGDFHASRQFKDQRPRRMYEAQAARKVIDQSQAYGRPNRRDQVHPPEITLCYSGLPGEVRHAAMRNQKMRRLNANVQSSRDSAYLNRNIPDLINSVGDAVIARYGEMRPELLKRLCLTVPEKLEKSEEQQSAAAAEVVEDEGKVTIRVKKAERTEAQEDSDYSANEFLARLDLLSTDDQERILAEVTAEYEIHIAELESLGENPLRPREIEGIVHHRKQKTFEGSEEEGAISAFYGPLHLVDVAIERVAKPIRAEDLLGAIETGMEGFGRVRKAVDGVLRDREMYLQPYLPKKTRSVRDAIAQGYKRINEMSRQVDDIASFVEDVLPGRELQVVNADGNVEPAIVVSIAPPALGIAHLASSYRVALASPGSTDIFSYRMSTLLGMSSVATRNDKGALVLSVSEGLEGAEYDEVLQRFEKAKAHTVTQAKILTTNIFSALRIANERGLGSLVSYYDEHGNRHRGVLVKRHMERELEKLSVRLDGVDAAYNVVVNMELEVNSSATGSKKSVVITPVGTNVWHLKLPSPPVRQGVVQWPKNPEYRALFERSNKVEAGRNNLRIEGDEGMRSVLETLSTCGFASYYVDSKHRHRFDIIDNAIEHARPAIGLKR